MKRRPPLPSAAALSILMAFAVPNVASVAPVEVSSAAPGSAKFHESADAGYLRFSGSERSSGLEGRWSKLIDLNRGRSRETTNYGIFSTAAVWDGRNAWRQDKSGGVHPINSKFMQRVHVTEAWLTRFGYSRSNALGARLEPLGDKTQEGHRYAVIRATPPAGEPVELWFDWKTKRLAQSVQIMTISILTTRYEDYRESHGLWIPFKITAFEGDPSNSDVIQIDRVDAVAATDADFIEPRPPDDGEIAGGKTTVPIEFDGDVVVEATLNGHGPFAFILDTGGHDILTPEAAATLGLAGVGAGTSGGSGAGTVSEQYVRIERMNIGGMTMRNQPFTVIALQYDTVERGARPPLAGILGLELFERFAMRLSYHDRTLTFEPFEGHRQNHRAAVPIFFSDDEPLLVAKIDGLSGDVGLDTGNSGTLIVQGIWAAQHGLKGRMMSGFPSLGFGMGGASSNWSSRADFEIAGHRFEHIVAHYAPDTKGSFSSRTESGNVGNEILANFTLDFDYKHGRIGFERVSPPPQQPFGRAGLTCVKERVETFKVVAVAAGSPAAAADVRVGDEIVAIDGTPSRRLSGWDFRRAIKRPSDTQLPLQIIREGKAKTIVLTLKELLP